MTARDGDGYTIIHRGRARGCSGVDSIQWDYPRLGLYRPLPPPRTLPRIFHRSRFLSQPEEFPVCQHASFRRAEPQSVLILCTSIISREKQSDIKYSILGNLNCLEHFSFEKFYHYILLRKNIIYFFILILPIFLRTQMQYTDFHQKYQQC